jgi:hypothetical protein
MDIDNKDLRSQTTHSYNVLPFKVQIRFRSNFLSFKKIYFFKIKTGYIRENILFTAIWFRVPSQRKAIFLNFTLFLPCIDDDWFVIIGQKCAILYLGSYITLKH